MKYLIRVLVVIPIVTPIIWFDLFIGTPSMTNKLKRLRVADWVQKWGKYE